MSHKHELGVEIYNDIQKTPFASSLAMFPRQISQPPLIVRPLSFGKSILPGNIQLINLWIEFYSNQYPMKWSMQHMQPEKPFIL